MCATRPEDLNTFGEEDEEEEVADTEEDGIALDEDNARDELGEQLNTQEDALAEEEDTSDNLMMILIILLCILVPLIGILICIVHQFRKNRTNSI